MYRILVANGVNLDLLGKRPRQHYGEQTLEDLYSYLAEEARGLEKRHQLTLELNFFQSNSESEYLQKLDRSWDAALLNPGAWTHSSLALSDRLEALQLPFVEVHLSQLSQREKFRQRSFIAAQALGVIHGFGFLSYALGLEALVRYLKSRQEGVDEDRKLV